jgi:CRISPR/Cas system-associated exonuclease Cas4 (RecB family)
MVVAVHRSHVAVEYAVCKAAARLAHEEIDEAIDTCIECLKELMPEPGDEVLLVEGQMNIEVDGSQITYRADAVYRRNGLLTVRDYKSRKELPRRRELPQDRQLALGALCAARTYGDTRVAVEIASIGSGVAVDSLIDRSAAQEAGRVVAETARVADADRVFEPRPGAECARCSVQAHCPVYNSASLITPESLLAGRIRQAGAIT